MIEWPVEWRLEPGTTWQTGLSRTLTIVDEIRDWAGPGFTSEELRSLGTETMTETKTNHGPTSRETRTFAGFSARRSWTEAMMSSLPEAATRPDMDVEDARNRVRRFEETFPNLVRYAARSRREDRTRDDGVSGTRDREPRTSGRERASRTGEHDDTDARWERG